MNKRVKKLQLALGEATHTHVLHGDIEVREKPKNAPQDESTIEYLLHDTGVVLHEEHDRVVMKEGYHVKVGQHEWSPFEGRTALVYD